MFDEIVQAQAGMFSQTQALQCGLTDDVVTANIVAGRWRRVMRGVYASTNGQLTRLGGLWGVLRMAGGATLSHATPAELHGLAESAHPIHVTVPTNRQPTRINGVYGDVREQPCATAVQAGTVLSGRGWRGRLRRCHRPDCIVL